MDKDDPVKILEDFFTAKNHKDYKKGEIVIRAGEEPLGVFYIKKGIVRQYHITPYGSEFTLNMFKPKAYFPMPWVIADIKNIYFFEAMTDLELNLAPKKDILNLIDENPGIIRDLLKRIYAGIEGIWIRMEALMTRDAKARVAAVLMIFAKRFGVIGRNKTRVNLRLTENEIASYAGLTRESVSRVIQRLKKNNCISLKRGFYTVDLKKLEEQIEYI